ncbi:tail-specific protease [Elizabethkingia sp. HvH-WGS333]|uniref:carboxy terminal-processing peptidase n=1 Tax=Elizabethkingia TaxID=308865 RepID=UPI0007415577|nr:MULTISPECIES: carboxy terminal-processing peptidase [Elizabethkingia]KUG11509.1 carboxyl-terminal protease [Elizabethkingia miricola]MCL1657635.1 carboxy terminal-processing peptidase [Elizabethkingia miricola]MCL1679770.1 carboxy terminal-processing peptidase [Elizabethkingia miricola]MCP1250310.1 carboxy terminal-processing peptidase [Elizabethkingia sp. S0634]MDX8567814.1 carboxy terminal-processing peptidase [Elizabethkingia sp. HX XZB]
MFKKFFGFNKLLLLSSLGTLIFCFNSPQNDDEKMQTIMVSVSNTLSYLSYNAKPINDAYSQDVYKEYFEKLDPSKKYFLQSDMDEFAKYKTKLDDYLKTGDITFFKLTNDRYLQRLADIEKMSQDIFAKPINLDEDEDIIMEPKLKKNPTNQKEMYAEWKKFIKYNILQEMQTLNEKEESQKKKKDSAIAKKQKDTIKYEPLTLEQKKVKATGEIKDLVSSMFNRIKKRKKMDWFSASYMNSYTEVFDPHTNYFSPKDKEDFDANFSGKIIGIGAQISEKKGRLFIGPLVIGAPAWKSKQVSEGDEVLKVKSDPKKEAVNVVGMLVDEAVRLIRGAKGSEVTLTLRKKDGSVKEVKLIREEVEMEDTFAKSIVVNSPNGKKYGFIYLPSFNADFNDSKGRNASTDVKNEITKLKAQNVEGIILDLRNNGGGSLTEVVDIMGLFMNSGPVVQVRSQDGKIQVLKNKNNAPVWTGPLVLMQNELSASASEILTGAIQDYGRGVILGAPHSFGKGTVQTFVSLNRFLNTNDDYGDLKLTIQKFYRISGNSTQLEGVKSDVVMDDYFTYDEIGEKYDEHALPWDQIKSSDYKPLNTIDMAGIVKRSTERIKANKPYQLLVESAKWRQALGKEETVTLNQTKFFELMKKRKEELKKFESLTKYDNGLQFTQYQSEVERMKKDEAFSVKSKNWIKNLKRDLYLQEAMNVISEIK